MHTVLTSNEVRAYGGAVVRYGAICLVIGLLFFPVSKPKAQPTFYFCGVIFDEIKGIPDLLSQIKEIELCRPGRGAIWRIRFDPKLSDPSHLAAMMCDFSQQILIHEAQGKHTVTCVVRDAPLFSY